MNILVIPGGREPYDVNTAIYKFFPSNGSTVEMGQLRESSWYMATTFYTNSTLLVFNAAFGSHLRGIMQVMVDVLGIGPVAIKVGELPLSASFPTTIWVGEEGAAYVFGASTAVNQPSRVIRFNQQEASTTLLPQQGPAVSGVQATVWDSRSKAAYIIGGFGVSVNDSRTDGILRVDLESGQHTFVEVS